MKQHSLLLPAYGKKPSRSHDRKVILVGALIVLVCNTLMAIESLSLLRWILVTGKFLVILHQPSALMALPFAI
ncbi:TPA: hypothetical protein I8669_002725 [Legionella pneumophila]|nr:hypothetical protein [Legionella pneumophila]